MIYWPQKAGNSMFGLSEKALSGISEVFRKYSAIEEAKIFGSRALDTHRPNSDVDIALLGQLNLGLVDRIKADLDEIATPYQFDVVAYNLIGHSKLKEHIDRFGKLFYRRDA